MAHRPKLRKDEFHHCDYDLVLFEKTDKFPNIPLGTYHNIPPNQQFMKDFLSFAGLGTPWSLLQRQPPIFCRLPCFLSTPKQSTDQPTHKRGIKSKNHIFESPGTSTIHPCHGFYQLGTKKASCKWSCNR